jgi:hypothetical protein
MTKAPWQTIPRYKQRVIHLEGDIDASAQFVWETLTHWGALLTWFNAVPDPIYPLISADLIAGQTEKDLPRTRRCVFDLDKLTGVVPEEVNDANFQMPQFVDEVLITADAHARYLAYNYSDHFHPGITTIQLIEDGPALCRFVIKYTTLEDTATPKLRDTADESGKVGYAFHNKADYRALKVYCEREWRRQSAGHGRPGGDERR